ncbi:TetR/AcrR family transcriptional regulator [Mycobacterium sp. CVI_P3]|uniref:TetR/AcrR family transcriptional regulator n=1 Tax=Mycobacterium pinniadriaticum TaxID=2994102 RepID=A0ABT3SMD9_9MYCO|nr:TetR/AcrR family transcriptional regulator [Mycobacterium pinniadriaticum]MCX2934283.1 TetR/AcrR family transcriptional regulator [Mycobacterium pinniadriaticum]MCX2940679.1 TetR/AcrR family transcriptional regulator [Mycobacterium pinniadriaticum]
MTVTTRKGRVSRATRREEIAHRLFTAAERMLDDGTSFAAISVEQLITGAEIARSTFYVYFEDKGALVLELADRVTREVGEAASAWFNLQPGATRGDLKAALGKIVKEYVRHRHMMAAVVEAAAYDERVRAQYARVMQHRFEDMATSFRAQQRAGVIAADLDIESVTSWLAWMIERGLYQLSSESDDPPADRLDGMTTIVWETLYARASRDGGAS